MSGGGVGDGALIDPPYANNPTFLFLRRFRTIRLSNTAAHVEGLTRARCPAQRITLMLSCSARSMMALRLRVDTL